MLRTSTKKSNMVDILLAKIKVFEKNVLSILRNYEKIQVLCVSTWDFGY